MKEPAVHSFLRWSGRRHMCSAVNMRLSFRRRLAFQLSSYHRPSFRFYSSKNENKKSYTKTVLLPQSGFKGFIDLESEKMLMQVRFVHV